MLSSEIKELRRILELSQSCSENVRQDGDQNFRVTDGGREKTEERSGIQVSTSALQNGGELLIYRGIPEGVEIRGFVVSFPIDGQAEDGKK